MVPSDGFFVRRQQYRQLFDVSQRPHNATDCVRFHLSLLKVRSSSLDGQTDLQVLKHAGLSEWDIHRLSSSMMLFQFIEDRTKPTCGQLRLACVTSEAVSKTRGRNGAEIRTNADLPYILTLSCWSSFVCLPSPKVTIEQPIRIILSFHGWK